MSIITKFKHRVETWIASIVRDEVSKINTSLEAERTAFCNLTKAAECTLNTSLVRLNELSHIGEATALRDHIRELEAKFTEVVDTLRKLHPTYNI